jgi:hypothetical protein
VVLGSRLQQHVRSAPNACLVVTQKHLQTTSASTVARYRRALLLLLLLLLLQTVTVMLAPEGVELHWADDSKSLRSSLQLRSEVRANIITQTALLPMFFVVTVTISVIYHHWAGIGSIQISV